MFAVADTRRRSPCMSRKKQLSLPSIWGQDYDLIKDQLYGAVPHHMLENLCQLGMTPSMEKLSLAMLIYRYSPPKRIPPAPLLAQAIRISRRHLYGMLKVMQEAGLVGLEKVGRAFAISISGLVQRLRSMKKAKDAAKPAVHLVCRPAPIPRPAPEPEPAPMPEPAATEEVEEDDLDGQIAAKLVEKTEMSSIMARHPVGSGPWRLAHRRWKDLDAWLARHGVLLAAVMGGG